MNEQSASDALAALGNRTRLRLYRLLVQAGDEGLIVGAVQRHLEIPASTLAHHLAALSRASLVEQERRGREVICRANYPVMHALLDFLTASCCKGVELRDPTEAA